MDRSVWELAMLAMAEAAMLAMPEEAMAESQGGATKGQEA